MGHKQETCRNTKPEAKKLAESMAAKKLAESVAAKKAKENKEKRERQKKKKEEQKKLAEKKKLEEVKKTRADSTSSSDCDSPVLVDARANRARGLQGQNTRSAGNFYNFPTIHEDIEQRTMEELAEELGRVKLARKEGASPTIEGNISGSSNMKNSTVQSFVCDTVCSFLVISDKIILTMGIPIRPFKNKPMNIVDASGNSLRLLGSSSFFITIPQVLGEKVERVEAAVLADNDVDSELLVSLSLLLAWDLVPPQFPRQTVSA